MPTGFHQATSDVEPIVGVQFGIFSPEEIKRRSVVEITTQATYEGNEPKIGGLFDPRMGVLDNGKTCRSCGQTNHGCPGHFGHYTLTRPVYYIQFLPMILNVLRCVCVRCSKLLIDKDKHPNIAKRKGEARWREVLALCDPIQRCGQEIEDGCGALQPKNYVRDGIARIIANFTPPQPLEAEYVLRLFKRITDEDVDFMGLSRHWCRPDWMICTVLPIPPPQVRPSVVQDNNQRSEDDLTHKLFEIIKNDKMLATKIENNASKNVVDDLTMVLQYHIATLVDNQIPGVAPSAQRSGRPLKSIQQRLGAKEGRIRYNIQGKRVEFSARSVITPDPNLSIAEIGVPLKIAMNLTVPERVTMYNRDRLYKFVQNGADKWPGAKTVVHTDGRMISLRHIPTNEVVLRIGDVVNRHLMDGDILLFNRQPTLHRMSMMGHKVKVLPFNTFRMNVSACTPYNADFDGDEMNAHIPQSYEAATELEELAAVPHQLITPRDAKPIIGIVQDTLVGVYRITRPNTTFNKREFMNMMMWNKRFDGNLPASDNEKYTGQNVVSALLPPINLEMQNGSEAIVKIREGEVLEGVMDKGIFAKPSKGIIHVAYNDYGPQTAVDLIDNMQNTMENYLVLNGFSVGISDLIADDQTKGRMEVEIQKRKKEIGDIMLQVHLDLFDNNTGQTNQQAFEDRVFKVLNQATDESGKIGQSSLADENRMTAMVRAGSKGGPINIAQMMACVGQQNIEGKRIPYGFTDRTLPHYKKYDDGPEARGFVESSFIRGLTPQEFFFHSMSGREGLIDTAVKTADTGYIQRQMVKALEDLVVQHDGTVRDANMGILQFHYGEDGTNATKIESQSYPLGKLTEADIEREYGMQNVDFTAILEDGVSYSMDATQVGKYVEQILSDQKMLVEGVFGSLHQGAVYSPVNVERLLMNIKVRFALQPTNKTDLTPDYVLDGINKVIQKTQPFNTMWCALLRFQLAPHKLIIKERFTRSAFDTTCEMLIIKNWQSWVQPGEQVGILAAQSIGEPSTQMTLNTFHLAGVASKSNVTRGVPRLKELLKVTKNPKAISLTAPMRAEYALNKEKAREVAQDLELTLLKDITTRAAIYYDPNDETTVLEEDRDLIKFYKAYEQSVEEDEEAPKKLSPWLLRIELDREKMFNKNISMSDVAFVLKNHFMDEISLVYSDYNDKRLIMRIRISMESLAGTNVMDDLTHFKKLQNKLLTGIVIRGIPGIISAAFKKDTDHFHKVDGAYKQKEQYVIETDGSNFLEVMNHSALDGSKIYSTHPHDIFDVLGVEASRAVLLNEMTSLFNEVGLNYRHLGLLCDMMTRQGRFMSIDRYGINKSNIGPLAKASFEETAKILLKASLFGEMDPVTGVSSNIMMGQTIRGGTSFSQLLLDEAALPRLLEGLPIDEIDEDDNEAEVMAKLEIDDINDACATSHFHMNVTMPSNTISILDEPEMEMTVYDE